MACLKEPYAQLQFYDGGFSLICTLKASHFYFCMNGMRGTNCLLLVRVFFAHYSNFKFLISQSLNTAINLIISSTNPFYNLNMIRDVKEIEESMIWEDTGRQIAARSKAQSNTDSRKIVVFVMGDKSSGKSSVIKVLRNDFDPDTKPNSLIEYWPSRVGLDKKQLIHFYQIGNPELSSFVSRFFSQSVRIYFLICVDLTQPNKIISSTTKYLQKIRDICAKKKNEPSDQEQKRKNHIDTDVINAIPAYVGLVGAKFDAFEKLDSQYKKWINRTLRYVAHTNSCSLMSSSNKNNQTGLQFRTFFNDLLNNSENPPKNNMKEFTKPVFCFFAQDKISQMNVPTSGSMTDIQVLQKHLDTGQKNEEKPEIKKEKTQIKGNGKLSDAIQKRRAELTQMTKKDVTKDKLQYA